MSRWADAELVVTEHLRASLPGVRVVTSLPGNLEAVLPVVRVTRGPGSDDSVTDSPVMDVESFTAGRDGMWDVAEDAREAMHALRGKAVSGRLVDTVQTTTGPVWVDYENPAVERIVASYRLDQRRTP